tara:strand:+ start:1113 stop:1235 length:123 start_codon:yes stop_codon:yes gene_type:complete
VPNRAAKERKRIKRKKNRMLQTQGRTAKQRMKKRKKRHVR